MANLLNETGGDDLVLTEEDGAIVLNEWGASPYRIEMLNPGAVRSEGSSIVRAESSASIKAPERMRVGL